MSIVDYADSASEDVDGRPMAAPPKDDLRIIFPDQPEKKATWPAPGNWARRYVHRLVVLDASVGLLAGGVAFAVRFGKFRDFTVPYLIFSAALPLLWLAALALGRAYEQRFLFDGNDEYRRVLNAVTGLTATLALFSYATGTEVARGYVLIALPLLTAADITARYAMRLWLVRSRARGQSMRKVVVVGYERAVLDLCRELRRNFHHGLSVVGACVPFAPVTGPADTTRLLDQGRVAVLGSFDDVETAVRRTGADIVAVLACPEMDAPAMRRLSWRLERTGTDLMVAGALLDVAGPRTTIRPVDGLPMMHLEHAELSGVRRLVKGIFDRVLAAAGLVVLAPALLLIGAAIRLTSPGPMLFRQVRVGHNGTEFVVLKLRTMVADAEQQLADLRDRTDTDGAMFKMRLDPRVTPVGRFLRRFSIDELPQLVNVLRGEMSLVGPRPLPAREMGHRYEEFRRRMVVKPGITGLWQVGGRSDLSWEDAVRLDLRYVENWSLSLDLVILLRTVTAVIRHAGAY
ncbi:sugar transferase [Fodinicola feengrottensis]|uniref:Sugar transferase n=1 Tax=Fodinicola feengrottensis TaxID=435914 RepID=A0ABN2HHZ9_9ACTN